MHRSEQEAFWAGGFGDEYLARHRAPGFVEANRAAFERMLARAPDIGSVLELGANAGLNLQALHEAHPDWRLSGWEINPRAHAELSELGYVDARLGSILEIETPETYDLVFTKGVLIHVDPDALPAVYDKLVSLARRYVLVAEYHNPTPVEVPYRGHRNRLFKRDFAGEILAAHAGRLTLLDYGFLYHGDPATRQDDLTWFLLRKVPSQGTSHGFP